MLRIQEEILQGNLGHHLDTLYRRTGNFQGHELKAVVETSQSKRGH